MVFASNYQHSIYFYCPRKLPGIDRLMAALENGLASLVVPTSYVHYYA